MRPLLPLLLTVAGSFWMPEAAHAAPPFAIDIDLTQQKAFLLQDGKIVYESPISSGRPTHRTPTGNFTITQKSADHSSSLYGKIVDANGKVLVRDADRDMPLPPGAKFIQAPMKNFLRFDGATGLHQGILPGYPASHGCVRLPDHRAQLFFDIVELGTPVRVFGTPPNTTPPERPVIAKAAPVATPTPGPRKWYQIITRVTPAPRPVKKAIAITTDAKPAATAAQSALAAPPAPASVAKPAPVPPTSAPPAASNSSAVSAAGMPIPAT